MRRHTLSLLLLISFSLTVFGQKADADHFILGNVEKIVSKELGETRTLNVYLPDGYAKSDTVKYPVIYLLDGSVGEDFVHVVGIVQFLSEVTGGMPPSIVVGIANVDRRRDFTFAPTVPVDKMDFFSSITSKDRKDFHTAGGSARFISFVERELEPYISKKYRTTTRTIIGQSLGGLVASEILLRRPNLFDQYVIVSPSLWWDNESLLTGTTAQIKGLDDKSRKVFIAVGAKEEDMMQKDAKKLADMLKAAGRKNLDLLYQPMPEETHLTILHNAVYKAFDYLYDGPDKN